MADQKGDGVRVLEVPLGGRRSQEAKMLMLRVWERPQQSRAMVGCAEMRASGPQSVELVLSDCR